MSKKSNTIGLTAVLTLAVTLGGILSVQAATKIHTWTGDYASSNEYMDSGNWDINEVPGRFNYHGSDVVDVAHMTDGTINKFAPYNGDVNRHNVYNWLVGANSAGDAVAEFEMKGDADNLASFKVTGDGDTRYIGGARVDINQEDDALDSDYKYWGGTGTVTTSTNSRISPYSPVVIGYGPDGDGTMNIRATGVDYKYTGMGADKITIGKNSADDGFSGSEAGYGTGTVEYDDGRFTSNGDIIFNKGTFRKLGSHESSKGVETGTGDGAGSWIQGDAGETATLEALIDDTVAGFTPIQVDDDHPDQASNGDVVFGSGALLDPGFEDGVDPREGTWTIMEWHGEVTKGLLSLADGNSGWTFDIDTDNNRLTASYVPEPGSLAMLLIGAAALLGTRRRRRC